MTSDELKIIDDFLTDKQNITLRVHNQPIDLHMINRKSTNTLYVTIILDKEHSNVPNEVISLVQNYEVSIYKYNTSKYRIMLEFKNDFELHRMIKTYAHTSIPTINADNLIQDSDEVINSKTKLFKFITCLSNLFDDIMSDITMFDMYKNIHSSQLSSEITHKFNYLYKKYNGIFGHKLDN